MTTLVHALHQRGGRYGLQTMCEGGGMANATIIGRPGQGGGVMSVPHEIGFDGVRVRYDSAEGYDELLADIGGKSVQINEFATATDDWQSYEDKVELLLVDDGKGRSNLTCVKPSSLMVVENNPELLSAAKKLDATLAAMATKVTKDSNE
jgi:hypothetical protein